MKCRMHLAWLGTGLCLLATLTACGPDIQDVASGNAPAPASAPTVSPTPRNPWLKESPASDTQQTIPGGQFGVTVLAGSQRPLDSVGVVLRHSTGTTAGEGWLTTEDGASWSGAVLVDATAAPGHYALEVVLNDGPFVTGGALTQSLYRYVPNASQTHYHAYINGIRVDGSVFWVNPLPSDLPVPQLTVVQVQTP